MVVYLSGDDMKKKKMKLSDIILPNKKLNYFVVAILGLGIVTGAIFLMSLNNTDRASTVKQIEGFIGSINKNTINSGLAFKNSLIINYIFVGLIWLLGFSIIGIVVNIFLTYIKGFIVGFSVASLILVYNYKALPVVFLYVFPVQVFNVLVVGVLTIYSIMFAYNLLRVIVSKKGNNRLMLKRYVIILSFSIIISFISSFLEVYFFPNILKIIISIYV